MPKRIALLGGGMNPSGINHLAIAHAARERFDDVRVIPCGPRPDKTTIADVDPIFRAIMTDMTFRNMPGATVDLSDLERSEFTRTHDLQNRFAPEGEVWHIVGADWVMGGRNSKSKIHTVWHRGPELWHELNFAVTLRNGYDFSAKDLPPKSELIIVPDETARDISSTDIRLRAFNQRPIKGLVTPDVHDYIKRHRLYRGRPPERVTKLTLKEPKPHLFWDEGNPEACRLPEMLPNYDLGQANCIVVMGGDGTMIAAMKRFWRTRLPFFGVNAGHRGYLLNEVTPRFSLQSLRALKSYMLPLLDVMVTTIDGHVHHALALNDAWVERSTPQTGWLQVTVDDRTWFDRMMADGILIATAAGSTAYAWAMGAHPLAIKSQELLLVGSNVTHPRHWKAVQHDASAVITVRNVDTVKRPIRACIDGEPIENVLEMSVRTSKIAAVELLSFPYRDLDAKKTEEQYPKTALRRRKH